MLYGPFKLLHRHQYFAQGCVNFRFPGIETCNARDDSLVVQYIAEETSAQYQVITLIKIAYFSIVLSTRLRCAKVVFAHAGCASLALMMALSIPSAVAGFIRPSKVPVAGQ